MARCPDCNKFVAYDDEMDVSEVEVSVDGDTLRVEGTVYLNCAECSTQLKSASVEAELDLENEFPPLPEEHAGAEVEYEMKGEHEVEATERSETKDRKGKTITKARYMKTYRGVIASDVEVIRFAVKGEERVEVDTEAVTLEWEEQASAFEDCN